MTAHDSIATLAGVLSGFALADVLQLLELGARTGDLAVDGGSRGQGAVQLRAGRVVAVTESGLPVAEADGQIASIMRMLDWSAGRWAFRAREEPATSADATAGGLAITTILVEAARRRDEHDRRSSHLPPSRAEPSYADAPVADIPAFADGDDTDGTSTNACLTAVDLQILAAVDGVRDVPAIATLARRDATQVAAAVGRLRALGVLRASVAAVSTVPESATFARAFGA